MNTRITWAVLFALMILITGAISAYGDSPVQTDADSGPTAAQPETKPTDALADLSLEDLMNITVTTASKKSETVAQTPAAVSVLTHEDIERWGYRTVEECLRRVAGFYTTNDLGYNYVGVRGFSRPDDYNSRVLILLDGHRLNEPIYDYAPAGFDFPLDVGSIERIEVVKGPGSALWGTNALLAVVNIIPRKAGDMSGMNTAAQGGSLGSTNFLVGTAGVHSDFEYAASSSEYNSSGRERIYFSDFDDPTTSNGIAEGLDGMHASKSYLWASYKGVSLLFSSGQRTKSLPTALYGSVFNGGSPFVRDTRTFTELSYDSDVSPRNNGKLSARLYQDRYAYDGDMLYDWPPVILNRDYARATWWGGSVQYSFDASPRLSSVVGLEYSRTSQCERRNYDPEPYTEYYSSSTERMAYSGYAQLDYSFSKKLRVVAGTRMDHYHTIGSHWNPRFAMVYAPDDRTSWKLLYGKAFRAPNDRDVYGSSSTNLSLRPEDMTTLEMVWERETAPGTRVQASVYQFDMRGIISAVDLGNDVVRFENVDAVRSKGIEVQIESYLRNDATAYAALSLSDATMEGEWISNSPHLTASGGISLPVFSKKAYLASEFVFVGNRLTLAGTDAGSKTMVNLILKTAKRDNGVDVRLGVYNLFDQTGYDPGGVGSAQARLPQVGRTFELRVSRRL